MIKEIFEDSTSSMDESVVVASVTAAALAFMSVTFSALSAYAMYRMYRFAKMSEKQMIEFQNSYQKNPYEFVYDNLNNKFKGCWEVERKGKTISFFYHLSKTFKVELTYIGGAKNTWEFVSYDYFLEKVHEHKFDTYSPKVNGAYVGIFLDELAKAMEKTEKSLTYNKQRQRYELKR